MLHDLLSDGFRRAASEGVGCEATNLAAHAGGYSTIASGKHSHSQGKFVEAAAEDSHVIGKGKSSDDDEMLKNTVQDSLLVGFGDGGDDKALHVISGGETGRVIQSVPDGAVPEDDFWNGSMQFYLDETGNMLKVKVQYSNGNEKIGEVATLKDPP